MSKQSQHVLIALPHPLLHPVSLGLVSFIFTLFSLELSQLAPNSPTVVPDVHHDGGVLSPCRAHVAGNCAELLAGKYRRIHPAFSTSSLNMTGRPSILLKPWSGQCCYVNCCRGITPCKIWLTGCVWHSAAPLFRLC